MGILLILISFFSTTGYRYHLYPEANIGLNLVSIDCEGCSVSTLTAEPDSFETCRQDKLERR